MSNQLLYPLPDTLHQALTLDPIDLSGKAFNTKSFTRAKLLRFLSETLKTNPDILTFAFKKQGRHADILVGRADGSMARIYFFLESSYQTTARDYLTRMLEQKTEPRRIDYETIQDFTY